MEDLFINTIRKIHLCVKHNFPAPEIAVAMENTRSSISDNVTCEMLRVTTPPGPARVQPLVVMNSPG